MIVRPAYPRKPNSSRGTWTPPVNRLWLALLAGLLLLPPRSQAQSVVIHLRNGDRLTGIVRAEDQQAVTLETTFGQVQVPLSLIASREPLESEAAGPETGKPVGKETPAAASSPVSAPQPASWRTNWHGQVQLGADLGFGTKDRQLYTARAQAVYARNRFQNGIDYAFAYGRTDRDLAANRMNGEMRTTIDFGQDRRLYAFNSAGVGYDEVRRIDLTYEEGAGLGYKFLSRSNILGTLETGSQYHRYLYTGHTTKENVSITLGQALAWNITPKLVFKERAQFLPDYADFGDYRLRFEASLSYPLWKSLTLSLNVIDLYDSRPPNGVQPNDLTIQSALGFTF
jgi:hypothetical protein